MNYTRASVYAENDCLNIVVRICIGNSLLKRDRIINLTATATQSVTFVMAFAKGAGTFSYRNCQQDLEERRAWWARLMMGEDSGFEDSSVGFR